MEIREEGRLLGTSDAERLMMAAGRHELDLVNDTLGYRARGRRWSSPERSLRFRWSFRWAS